MTSGANRATARQDSAGGSGWLRLSGSPAADSGEARLVDADGGALGATWRREIADSVHVVAFDDFLRVELRLAMSDSAANGQAVATSDAALERDSAGEMREMRRSWVLTARRAPCDRMPVPAQPHLR